MVKNPLGILESSRHNSFFQGGDDGRGYRNMCKIPRGPMPVLGDLKQYQFKAIHIHGRGRLFDVFAVGRCKNSLLNQIQII